MGGEGVSVTLPHSGHEVHMCNSTLLQRVCACWLSC